MEMFQTVRIDIPNRTIPVTRLEEITSKVSSGSPKSRGALAVTPSLVTSKLIRFHHDFPIEAVAPFLTRVVSASAAVVATPTSPLPAHCYGTKNETCNRILTRAHRSANSTIHRGRLGAAQLRYTTRQTFARDRARAVKRAHPRVWAEKRICTEEQAECARGTY